jgi:hypothetical protein
MREDGSFESERDGIEKDGAHRRRGSAFIFGIFAADKRTETQMKIPLVHFLRNQTMRGGEGGGKREGHVPESPTYI